MRPLSIQNAALPAKPTHSTLAPENLTTFSHLSASGGPINGSPPSSIRRFLISGSVGTSGNSGERTVAVTASARSAADCNQTRLGAARNHAVSP
jgi:hypothetical protein